MKEPYAEYVAIFKAVSDETRLHIIDMLSCGELCACDILEEFGITQPTLSYHLKILTESNLVNVRKVGPRMEYTINQGKINEVLEFIKSLTSKKEDCICKKRECKECSTYSSKGVL